ELRQKGIEGFKTNSFPGRKDEEWRFISLRDLYNDSYVPASQVETDIPDLSSHYIPESDGARLVFVNGRISEEHSSVQRLPNEVTLGNISDLSEKNAELVKR